MPKLNHQGKDYAIKTLKGLTSQGIRLKIPNEDLIPHSTKIDHPELVVTPVGDKYAILLGDIKSAEQVQTVRMLSKMLLKKALWEVVNPPPEARRTYTDATPQYHQNRSYGGSRDEPRNNYHNDRGNRW